MISGRPQTLNVFLCEDQNKCEAPSRRLLLNSVILGFIKCHSIFQQLHLIQKWKINPGMDAETRGTGGKMVQQMAPLQLSTLPNRNRCCKKQEVSCGPERQQETPDQLVKMDQKEG